MKFTREQIIAAFWAKVDKTKSCWNWTGSGTATGYGTIWRGFSCKDRTMQVAHRFSYELLVGKIPNGMELDHLCKNRKCVNPAHLEVVTHRENLKRGDGFAGANLRKTHCPKGHPYSGDNLAKWNKPGRHCMACHRARVNAAYHEKRSRR